MIGLLRPDQLAGHNPDEACTQCNGNPRVKKRRYSNWILDENNEPQPRGAYTEYWETCTACDGTGSRVVQVTNALLRGPEE